MKYEIKTIAELSKAQPYRIAHFGDNGSTYDLSFNIFGGWEDNLYPQDTEYRFQAMSEEGYRGAAWLLGEPSDNDKALLERINNDRNVKDYTDDECNFMFCNQKGMIAAALMELTATRVLSMKDDAVVIPMVPGCNIYQIVPLANRANGPGLSKEAAGYLNAYQNDLKQNDVKTFMSHLEGDYPAMINLIQFFYANDVNVYDYGWE